MFKSQKCTFFVYIFVSSATGLLVFYLLICRNYFREISFVKSRRYFSQFIMAFSSDGSTM